MEKLVIQSDINNLIEVERFVSAVCDTYNINNYAATISMSLLQAVKMLSFTATIMTPPNR